jgi:methionyl-tRNA formyltransferase
MRVVEELDAGPTFAMAHRPVGPDETSVDVERDLARMGAALLADVMDQLADGSAIETPQNHAQATYAPKLVKAEGSVDWTLPARRIHNLVRGLQPWPLVSARVAGVRVIVHRTVLTGETSAAPPATLTLAEGDRLEVAAGDQLVIRIVEIQPEGRRRMSAREFLAARQLDAGTRIEPA